MKTNRFWVFIAFMFGVIAFVCLVGLCSMAMASDIPTAQRVKVMDGDSALSNILGTAAHPMRNDPTGTTNQPVTQATSPWVTSRNWTLSNGTDSIAAVESGTWVVRNQDGAGNALTSQVSGSFRPLDTEILVAGVTVDPRARTWTLSNGTDSIAAVESGTWSVRMQDGAGNAVTSQVSGSQRPLDTQTLVSGTVVDPRARTWTLGSGGDSVTAVQGTNPWTDQIKGATDGTIIGNAADRLKVDNGGVASPMINRTDIASQTVATSGSSSAFDTAGMAYLNVNYQVTAISGAGAYIQIQVQTSDDGSAWATYMDTPRLTATGFTRYQALRQSGRYYRFNWIVGGTTPSVTFQEISTLKAYAPPRKSARFNYADIDLSTNGNASSVFTADDCYNMNVVFVRAAGGANATVQIFGSNDTTNWVQVFGNIAVNAATTNSTFLQAQAWRYYEAQVTAHAAAGITADVQWSCN